MENQNTPQPQITQPQISPGKWALYIFVSGIPLVGLIMLFVWGFGDSKKKSRSNWAKGMLLILLIIVILYAIAFAIFGAALAGFSESQSGFNMFL